MSAGQSINRYLPKAIRRAPKVNKSGFARSLDLYNSDLCEPMNFWECKLPGESNHESHGVVARQVKVGRVSAQVRQPQVRCGRSSSWTGMAILDVARITGMSLAMIGRHCGHFAIHPCPVSARPRALSTDVQSCPPVDRLDQIPHRIFLWAFDPLHP